MDKSSEGKYDNNYVKSEAISIEEITEHTQPGLKRVLVGLNTLQNREDFAVELLQNYDIMTLDDGLELMQSLPRFRPDVIIVESDLHSISGFQISHILKDHADLSKIPIFLLLSHGYQIGEFVSRESHVEACRVADDTDPKQFSEIMQTLVRKSKSDSIDEETWIRLEKQFAGTGFVENFSTKLDQIIIENAILNRIALLAQESTDFRKLVRSIMILLRDILEYSAVAIRTFENDEVFNFVHNKMENSERIKFLEESNEYSNIYKPFDLPESLTQTDIPLGTFKIKGVIEESNPTIFTVPLVAMDATIGTLTLLTYKSAARREYYLKTLQLVAYQIALALNNAMLYQKIHKLSTIDELTSLPNRRAFYEVIQSELVRSRRFKDPLSLAIIDIDHFKNVNDTYGHLQGDLVLQECGNVFRTSVRDKIDTVARFGGEEFVILLPQTNLERAQSVVERLHSAIADHNFRLLENAGFMHITVSIGLVSVQNGHEYSLDEIINTADKALYEAKESGRNQIVIAPLMQS
jgi:diguanylate cyclase (GGDEF)-like protein